MTQEQTQPQPTKQPTKRVDSLRAMLSQQGQRSTHGSGVVPQAARTAAGERVWCQHPNCKGTKTNPARWHVQPKAGKAYLSCTTHKRVAEKQGAKVTSAL